jgi:ATP-dependent exoDNAse (exonuclease V) beta subunit
VEVERKDEGPLNAVLRGLVAHSLLEDEIFDNYEILRSRVLSQIRHSAQFAENRTAENFCKEVYVNLRNYRDSVTFQDSCDEFYNEVPFEVEIGSVKLYGIIDKLYRSKSDGLFRVLDFKTNTVLDLTQASRAVQKHRYDLQVQCYCLAAEKVTGKKIKEARLFFSHIPSKMREIIIPFDSHIQGDLLSKLDTLASNIKAEYYPASPSSTCEVCSYNSYCGI